MQKIKSSEITPESQYLSRREFLKGLGVISASSMILAACEGQSVASTAIPTGVPASPQPDVTSKASTPTPIDEPVTSFEAITNYNNYYEFTTDKGRVAPMAKDFPTSPWQVEVGGLVNKPKTYDLDDISKFSLQERIYRLRCVEAWSMVIPWVGFPLAELLKEVEPTSEAQYVRFETIYNPDKMPGQKSKWYQWPYIEGLRLDEAMHDLTILATGLYGKELLPQNGAPIRLVVPWKYGFKSIKAIVKIDLVAEMPTSLWMAAAPQEYGFYANVNPEVSHPRWSQASERRIGENSRIETLMFNGYEEEVAHLYDTRRLNNL
jgi:sulfoxide reductase catalytic subunit YedY